MSRAETPALPRHLLTAALVAAALTGCVPGTIPDDDTMPPMPSTGGIAGTGGRGSAGGAGGGGTPITPPASLPPVGGSAGGPGPAFLGKAAVSAERFTPALSGGTLLVLADGDTAFAADPDRDALYLTNLRNETLLGTLALTPGDEPGRAVEDGRGNLHVVLRGAGAVQAVDPRGAGALGERRPVCAAPRGIAYDSARDLLHVACAGGELVSMPAAGGAVQRTLMLERDLRDVVAAGDRLYVSQFRSANLLVVSALDGGVIERRSTPGSSAANQMLQPRRGLDPATGSPTVVMPMGPAAQPGVAWRLRPLAGGGAVMLHQESTNDELGTERGGYGGGPCKSPMAAAVTRFPEGGAPTTSGQIVFAILPLDFAYSRDGKRVAFVFAGNASDVTRRAPQVFLASASDTPGALGSSRGDPGCIFPTPQPPPDEPIEFRPPVGETIAVDFDGQGRVVVQTREPARLEILSHRGGTIKLSDTSRFDSGQAVFHMATVNGLACASCHPEGGDDGRIWSFQKLGIRRTQNLRGGIAKTAPFHWDGDMRDLTHLMTEVFTGRMGGPGLTADHVQALGSWMDRLPSVGHTPAGDAAAVARGKLLFEDAKVACATCHAGPQLTNNTTVDVGTGKAFQVPSLRGLSARAPYMHDGCAKTLADRFAGSCGGGDKHGVTSQLTPAQITDLVSYLETL